MKTYRMSIETTLYFDVEAETDDQAKEKAIEIIERALDEGASVPNCDTEDELQDAVVYGKAGVLPAIVDVEEPEDEEG